MAAVTKALVGRTAEVEFLAASLEAAAEGRPRFVLVAGEAGIGKTQLLREAAGLAPPLGLRVCSGTAIEGGSAMPYLPLLSALAECSDGAAGEPAELVRRLVVGQPSPGGADAADGARLLEAIFAVFVREPTLLVVDDVQWADSATVALLDYVSQRAHAESLAVLVAARNDAPALLERLPLADGRRFVRLTLGRLSRDEVIELIEALLAHAPEADLVANVFARSAGNPFFVEQLLATTVKEPPPSLRALVLTRLAELSRHDRRVIEALAILARPADEELLAGIAGVEEAAAEAALGEAATRGVTVPADTGFAFRHPLFPEVVIAELPGPTRRRLHRAAAIELAANDADPVEVASHWWESGDAARAWASALEAAERAERLYAFAEARLHLERALEVWPAGTDGQPECLLRAAHATWLAGDAAAAVTLAQRAAAEGAADDAELHIAIGRYAAEAGEMELSIAAFERAAAVVRADDSGTTRALAEWALARARLHRGRFAEARHAAARAVEIAREAGDPFAEASARFARGMGLAFEGSLAGLDDVERGVSLALEATSPAAAGRGYEFLTLLLSIGGEVERALAVALEGIDRCEALGVARTHGSQLRAFAALIQHELGRWDQADVTLSPAAPLPFVTLVAASMAMRRGHFERGEALIERAAASTLVGASDSEVGRLRAELAWLRGDLPSARVALESLPEEPGIWGAAAAAEAARLEARLAADDPRHTSARPTAEVRHLDPKLDAALRAEIAAEATRARGESDPDLWALCTAAWTATGREYDRIYARIREAEALFAAGVRGPAREALRDAAASASALGARPLHGLAEDLARRARVAAELPRRDVTDRDQPTRRELDVLALLAEGLTNREIAARLFLSPKTVGIHVSRLLRKLDAHTRGEAVAVARRRGILV